MTHMDLDKAKDHLPELVEQAVSGEEVLITKDSQPLVRLVAVKALPRGRHFGSAKGLIVVAQDFDAPLADFAGGRYCHAI